MKVINREKFPIPGAGSIYRLSAVQFSNGGWQVAIERKMFGDNWEIDYYWMEQIFFSPDVYGEYDLTAADVADCYRVACLYFEKLTA
jgi:hypothetical protein